MIEEMQSLLDDMHGIEETCDSLEASRDEAVGERDDLQDQINTSYVEIEAPRAVLSLIDRGYLVLIDPAYQVEIDDLRKACGL
jgi:hypothetical protein